MCSSTTFCFAPEEIAEVLDPNGCAFHWLHKDEEYPGSDLDVNSTDDSPLTGAEADVGGQCSRLLQWGTCARRLLTVCWGTN